MSKVALFNKVTVNDFRIGVFNAYSVVFFSDNKIFGFVLIAVTFIDWPMGVAALLSVFVANGVAMWLGFDKHQIKRGYFGFNALLTGLGLAMYFEPSAVLMLMIVIGALFSLFITIGLKGFLGNYGLPFLSLPFIFTLWIVLLASNDFVNLGLSERGLYTLNTLYSRGGVNLIHFYQWVEGLPMFDSLRIYLRSMAAIFFQQNLFAGILIALGLLLSSRIAFSLSLIGFYSAYLFYTFIGADFQTLNYSYIGFNYILASIALGGYFLIPSKTTYLWVVLIIPLLATLTISLSKLFSIWNLSIYALSFNIIVILFLYVLKLRGGFGKKPAEVIIQHNSPEKNLYAWKNEVKRFGQRSYVAMKLPFFGVWNVSQGHNGKLTHKDEWQYAWDFVIQNSKGEQYKNDGYNLSDYYCYEKAVIAPADGIVVQVINNIEDNDVGDVNTIDNWGNTIVIKHTDYLYSKVSHLKEGSILVVEGQAVKYGDVIGKVGNSGRSPFPHLHFQLQETPFIGSATIKYSITSYILDTKKGQNLKLYSIPAEGNNISNIQRDELLSGAFHFIPGQKICWSGDALGNKVEWEVMASVYNKIYLYCSQTKSIAWFENDGSLFYFTHFEGDRKSLLYQFYKAFFIVPLSFNSSLEISDYFPVNKVFNSKELLLQDFVAPFYIYKNAAYSLKYDFIDNEAFPSEIRLKSSVTKSIFKKEIIDAEYAVKLDTKGLNEFVIKTKSKQQTVRCIG